MKYCANRRHVFRLLMAKGIEHSGHINEIIQLARGKKLLMEEVQRNQLDKLGMNHQGIALQASAYPMAALDEIIEKAAEQNEHMFVLVLDEIQDPQNLGTLLRTAEAVGIHGVVLPFRRTASVTPAVVSASSGAVEHLLITQLNLAQGLAQVGGVHRLAGGADGVDPVAVGMGCCVGRRCLGSHVADDLGEGLDLEAEAERDKAIEAAMA